MSTSPLAKRQRLLHQQQNFCITTLPFETLFVVASFLGPQDALALGLGVCSRELLGSCALWQQIARNVDPILEEIFVSLSNQFAVTDEAALWRRCALSRESLQRQSLWSRDCETKEAYLPTRVKPLRAYSFLLNMEKVVYNGNKNKKCSVFLENIENDYEEEDEDYDCFFKFKIPDKHLADYFPWGDDWYNQNMVIERYDMAWPCRVDTTFTVYAIDRNSGKHAKIYYSGRNASLYLEYWQFPRRNCGAPTKYPALQLQGYFNDPWKYGEYSGLENKAFKLHLRFRTHHGAYRYDVAIKNLLVFLQREPIYV